MTWSPLIAVALANATIAAPPPASYQGTPLENGGAFHDRCEKVIERAGSDLDFGFCLGYLQGVIDTENLRENRKVCVDGIPNKVLIRAVVASVDAHPDRREISVIVVVLKAMLDTFPCGRQ